MSARDNRPSDWQLIEVEGVDGVFLTRDFGDFISLVMDCKNPRDMPIALRAIAEMFEEFDGLPKVN